MELNECEINEHTEGGIMVLTDKMNNVTINGCKIYSNSNFGIRLNLPKEEKVLISEDDFLVVLSEDEL